MNVERSESNLTSHPKQQVGLPEKDSGVTHEGENVKLGNLKRANIPSNTNLPETSLNTRYTEDSWLERTLSAEASGPNNEFYQGKVEERFQNGIINNDTSVKDLVDLLNVAVISDEENDGAQLYKIASLVQAMLSFRKSLFTENQLKSITQNILNIANKHPKFGAFGDKILTTAFQILSEIICKYELDVNTIGDIKDTLLVKYHQTNIPSIKRNARNLLFGTILNSDSPNLSINELVAEFSLKDVHFLINEALDICKNENDFQRAKRRAEIFHEIFCACSSRGDVFPLLNLGEYPAELNTTLLAKDINEYKEAFKKLETEIKLAAPSLLLPLAHLGTERKLSDSEILDIDNKIVVLEFLEDGDAEQLPQAKDQLVSAVLDLQDKNKNWQALTNFSSRANDFIAEDGKNGFEDMKNCWENLKKNARAEKKLFGETQEELNVSLKDQGFSAQEFDANVKKFKKLFNNFGNLTQKEHGELNQLWDELSSIFLAIPGRSSLTDWTSSSVQNVWNFLSSKLDDKIKNTWKAFLGNPCKVCASPGNSYNVESAEGKYWVNMKIAFNSFKDLIAVSKCDPKTYIEQKLRGKIIDSGAVSGEGKYHNNCCFLSILGALKKKFSNGVNGRQISDIWPDAEDLRTGVREFIRQKLTEDQKKSIKALEKQEESAATNEEKKNIQSKIAHIVGNYGRDFIDLRSGNQVFCSEIFSEYISIVLGTPIAIAIFEDDLTEETSRKIPGRISVLLPNEAGRYAVIKSPEEIQPFVELAVKSSGAIQNGKEVTILTLYHGGIAFRDNNGTIHNSGHYQVIQFN